VKQLSSENELEELSSSCDLSTFVKASGDEEKQLQFSEMMTSSGPVSVTVSFKYSEAPGSITRDGSFPDVRLTKF
jgi:hypothetical protein